MGHFVPNKNGSECSEPFCFSPSNKGCPDYFWTASFILYDIKEFFYSGITKENVMGTSLLTPSSSPTL